MQREHRRVCVYECEREGEDAFSVWTGTDSAIFTSLRVLKPFFKDFLITFKKTTKLR